MPRLPLLGMAQSWPLEVGSHEVVPVALPRGWARTVHLTEHSWGGDLASATPEFVTDAGSPRLVEAAPARKTLCGRPYVAIVTEPGVDLLGDDAGRMCKSCWRSVERWLSPPPAAVGEDEVIRWLTTAVLEIGEAMVQGVPVPRLEAIRRRVRKELKAAIGGSVNTHVIGRNALWVRSGLVIDAKTPEQWQRELHAAMEEMWAIEVHQPVDAPRWRRHWDDIVGIE